MDTPLILTSDLQGQPDLGLHGPSGCPPVPPTLPGWHGGLPHGALGSLCGPSAQPRSGRPAAQAPPYPRLTAHLAPLTPCPKFTSLSPVLAAGASGTASDLCWGWMEGTGREAGGGGYRAGGGGERVTDFGAGAVVQRHRGAAGLACSVAGLPCALALAALK